MTTEQTTLERDIPETGKRNAPIPPWVPLAVLAVVIVRVTFVASGPIRDPDAWWHLRAGHQFWSGEWKLWNTGPLSSFATEEWIPRDWIPQLVASKFEDWFGLPGVAWLYGAALIAFLVVGYVTCRRVADPLPAALTVGLVTVGAMDSLSQRPQMISFILMFVVVATWQASIEDLRPRWWLIPLTWFWAASHGMWYCGVAIGVVAVAGVVLDRRVKRRQALTLAAVPLLSLVAAAATPVGPKLLLTVVETADKWQFVTEWQPPSFREMGPAITMVMVSIVVLHWARRETTISWSDIGLLAVATCWTLLSARSVVLGAIALAPLVATSLQLLQSSLPATRVRRAEHLFLGGVAAVCLTVLALVVPSTAQAPGNVPSNLNDDLAEVPAGSTILNDYVLGGWLHWRHPDLQTVVDGFTDGYTAAALAEYGNAAAVASGWDAYVEDTGAEVALLRSNSPLAVALVDRLDWSQAGEDAGYVLLVAPD